MSRTDCRPGKWGQARQGGRGWTAPHPLQSSYTLLHFLCSMSRSNVAALLEHVCLPREDLLDPLSYQRNALLAALRRGVTNSLVRAMPVPNPCERRILATA